MRKNLIRTLLVSILVMSAVFTYSQSIRIDNFSPAAGAPGTLLTINGIFPQNQQPQVSIGGVAAIVLSNSGSQIKVMLMPGASYGVIKAVFGSQSVSIGGFGYINTSGILSQQGSPLQTDSENQGQASSVALSADGNTLAVGFDGGNTGGVWVFTRLFGDWVLQSPKLVGSDYAGTNSQQGKSVALSADGNTLVVGAPGDGSGTPIAAGAIWIFSRNGNTWTQDGSKLVGTGSIQGANQGWSVAISADEKTILSGGQSDEGTMGAVWVFAKLNGLWQQVGDKLVGSHQPGEACNQGASVALTADGNTAFIGGPKTGSNKGEVWIFSNSSGVWTEKQTVKPAVNSRETGFGGFLSVSADGKTLLVGVQEIATAQGGARIYTLTANNWQKQADLLPGGVLTGSSTGVISADGNYAALGTGNVNDFTGYIWMFARNGINWSNVNKFETKVSKDYFGTMAAMSADGNTVAAGTIRYNPSVIVEGTFVFARQPDRPSKLQGSALSGNSKTGFALEGSAVAISADGNIAVSGALGDGNGVTDSIGSAFMYIRKNGVWQQIGNKLTAQTATARNAFGSSVAINADGSTVVVAGVNNNNGQGALWVFEWQGNTWILRSEIHSSDGAMRFGTSVSISADGNTIVAGVPNVGTNAVGAYVFIRQPTGWIQQSKLAATVNGGSVYMQSGLVNISADGKTIIMSGSILSNGYRGGAWVFRYKNNMWSQQGDVLKDAALNAVITSVSVSGDGNTALIGDQYEGKNSAGAAWVFAYGDNGWQKQTELLANAGTGDYVQFGSAVTLSGDGNTAAIGGIGDTNSKGAVWIFTRNGTVWATGVKMQVNDGSSQPQARLGQALALSTDGSTLFAGGPVNNSNKGSVWFFTGSSQ